MYKNEFTTQLIPTEPEDLPFIKSLKNNRDITKYWFIESYNPMYKLKNDFYKKNSGNNQRSFIIKIYKNVNNSINVSKKLIDYTSTGLIELVDIDFISRTAEVQLMISPKFQGHGLAQKSLKKSLDFAFLELNLKKVYLYVDTHNLKAIHIYKKIGFKIEGNLKKQFFVEGKYHDAYIMSIFK